MKGKLKFFREGSPGKSGTGFGFIQVEDGQDVFFHHTQWEGPTPIEEVADGTLLEFEMGTNHKGTAAINVRIAEIET